MKIDKIKLLIIASCIAIVLGMGFAIDQSSSVPNIFEPANHRLGIEIENVTVINTSTINIRLFNNDSERLFDCMANITSPITTCAKFGTLDTESYMNLTIALKPANSLPDNYSSNSIQIYAYGYGLM
jgi:hypothetical protein